MIEGSEEEVTHGINRLRKQIFKRCQDGLGFYHQRKSSGDVNARLLDVLCTQEANTELLLKQNFKLQNVLVENNNRLLNLLEQ